MPLVTAYLALGSNVGERLGQMRSAVCLLRESGVSVLRASSVYQNRAIGMGPDAGQFLNAVVEVETELPPEALLDVCLDVESQLGRVRTGGWSPRTIDVDVLLYGGLTLESERLSLPHPRIVERDFVLCPLCDLNPDLILNGQTVAALLDALPAVDLELQTFSLLA